MKSIVGIMVFILFGMVSSDCRAQDAAGFAGLYRAGQAHQKAGRYAEARGEYEKALAIEGITLDQTGQALVKIGAAYISERKVQDGAAALKKARALKGITNQTKIQANLLIGQTYLAYPWVLDQSRP